MREESSGVLARLSRWYDVLSTENNISRIERAIISFALVGFALHL